MSEPCQGHVTVIRNPDLGMGGKNHFIQNLVDFQVSLPWNMPLETPFYPSFRMKIWSKVPHGFGGIAGIPVRADGATMQVNHVPVQKRL